jgi:hypothetical protein
MIAAKETENYDLIRAMQRYAEKIGLNRSNTLAAINYAMRQPGKLLAKLRAGRIRADVLIFRQETKGVILNPESQVKPLEIRQSEWAYKYMQYTMVANGQRFIPKSGCKILKFKARTI